MGLVFSRRSKLVFFHLHMGLVFEQLHSRPESCHLRCKDSGFFHCSTLAFSHQQRMD
jgi:hypothetical protein